VVKGGESLKDLDGVYNTEIDLKNMKCKYVPWIHQGDIQNHFRALGCYSSGGGGYLRTLFVDRLNSVGL
jgi:hypothetical protein